MDSVASVLFPILIALAIVGAGLGIVIGLFVFSVQHYWVNRGMSILVGVAKVVVFFIFLKSINTNEFISSWYKFPFAYINVGLTLLFSIYMIGPACFDSGTEGDIYLIGGTLVKDTNHPFRPFITICIVTIIISFLSLLFMSWIKFIWILLIFSILELGIAIANLVVAIVDNAR